MKFTKVLCILFVIIALFLDTNDAKRGSSSSRSSSSRGYSGYSGGSSTRTTRTYTRVTGRNGSSMGSGYRVTWVVPMGTMPYYYNPTLGYYYDGHNTYVMGGGGGGGVVVVIIVILIIFVCIALASKGNYSGDDEYVTETVTVEEFGNAPLPDNIFDANAPRYMRGQNPPGTILCNYGHAMSLTF